jgi:hypothetical protein
MLQLLHFQPNITQYFITNPEQKIQFVEGIEMLYQAYIYQTLILTK